MKLFIEVEVAPDEIPLATELFRSLRSLTDHVKTRDVKKLFELLISRLEDSTQLDDVAPQIATLLNDNHLCETVCDDFLEAFMMVVFNPDLVLRQQSVVPFMHLLTRLPEPAKTRVRDGIIPKVLKHLTVKRPIDANRKDFFSYAESFAALINMELIPLTGAVTTIMTLLRKPENRCAAVTMLGKTVELCLQQLTEKCEAAILADLSLLLQSIKEETFLYDINYIEESMGWNCHATNAQHDATVLSSKPLQGNAWAVEPTPTGHGLCAIESYRGHRNTIFAMAYDERRNQLVSSGKDGVLIVWTGDGQVVETLDMPRHYACCMDIHSSLQALLVCGVAKEEVSSPKGNQALPSPCIISYGAAGHGWKEQGILSKDSSKLVSCIKAFEVPDHAFITGETIHIGLNEGAVPQVNGLVCYYDIQSVTSFPSMQPVKQYAAHEDLITCLSLFPPNPNLFMSGSRDSTVRVWDRRGDRCVGMFGTVGKTGRVQAHDAMITCIDAFDSTMILSAGMDTLVHRWDIRTLGSHGGSAPIATLQLDDSAILKVALGGCMSTAAVSTLRGLYMVDFSNPRPVPCLAKPFQDARRTGRYHDLKWAARRPVLYAAGDNMCIDVYAFH